MAEGQPETTHTADGSDGSNSKPKNAGGVAGERLLSFIERIERLNEEKKALAEDIKEIFSEAKSNGFEVKIIRMLIRLRSRDKDDVDEEEALLDVYKRAIGMR